MAKALCAIDSRVLLVAILLSVSLSGCGITDTVGDWFGKSKTPLPGERTAVFASDWPHHDFDHPQHVFGLPFSPEARRAILGRNGARFYGIEIPAEYRPR